MNCGVQVLARIADLALMTPYTDRLILTATTNPVAVRRPIDREDLVLMAGQILFENTGANIPSFQCSVFATADKQSTVWAKCTLVNGTNMATERGDVLAITSLPEFHVVVESG